MSCPFECGFGSSDPYLLSFHLETVHAESGRSGFAIDDDEESLTLARQLQNEEDEAFDRAKPDKASHPVATSSHNDDIAWPCPDLGNAGGNFVECSLCSEILCLLDYNDHLDIHTSLDEMQTITNITGDKHDSHPSLNMELKSQHGDTAQDTEKQKYQSTSSQRIIPSLKQSQSGHANGLTKPRSLTKDELDQLLLRELGPFALEKQMPKWLYRELERGPSIKYINRIGRDGRTIRETIVENEVSGIVPVLSQLSGLSTSVETAYFCHPSVHHIFKRKGHGGFCGYLNIQMQISYMQGARAHGYERFGSCIPSILVIQDMIENAWEMGINTLDKSKTGGVLGTRKWIGTPELSAIFKNLAIPYQSDIFFNTNTKHSRPAYHNLLDFAERYFSENGNAVGKIRTTLRPPLYLQRYGHALTIVGLERLKDGSRNLLVFDCAFGPSKDVKSFVGKTKLDKQVHGRDLDKMLRPYRQTSTQLKKHEGFEVLSLTAPLPPVPA